MNRPSTPAAGTHQLTPGEWRAIEWVCHAPTTVAAVDLDGRVRLVVAECSGHGRDTRDSIADARLIAASKDLLTAARPLVAMTFAEARAAEDRGDRRLMYCQHDVRNPCWDGQWGKEHGAGKHWDGSEACPECNLRAAIAKATGSAA